MNKYINVFIPSPYDFSRTTRWHVCEYCGKEMRPDWHGDTCVYIMENKKMCERCYNANYRNPKE